MSSLKSSGIAFLGAGIFAREAHLPALATLGDTAPPLKAVYSRSEKSARDLSEAAVITLKLNTTPSIYHDGDISANLDVLLARQDITIIIIALPITLQPSFVLKSLAAGKHVLSEKPVAPDVKQGLEIISTYNRLYKNKGLVWRIAENFEAEPGHRVAAAAIRSGKIGKVIFFKMLTVYYLDQENGYYKTPWRTAPDHQGGFLLDGGVHTPAALRTILPEPLTHLSAFTSSNKDFLKPHDTIHAIAKAGDKFHGIVVITFASPTQSRPEGDEIVITGTEGWISIKSVDKPGITGVRDESAHPQRWDSLGHRCSAMDGTSYLTSPHLAGSLLRLVIKTKVNVEGKLYEEREEVIEVAERGVEAELASFFDAISGTDDGLGDPLSALSDVAFIQAALNSDGNLVDLTKMLDA